MKADRIFKKLCIICVSMCVSILLIVMSTGCDGPYPHYKYAIEKQVPDSLKAKEMQFITETMKATDFHLTTSDYEDPEDVVQKCKWAYEDANSMPVEGLYIETCRECYRQFVPYNLLNANQKLIFERLRDGKGISSN